MGACFGRGLSGVWRKLTDLDRTTTDASCSLSRASSSIVVAVVSVVPADDGDDDEALQQGSLPRTRGAASFPGPARL